MVKILIILSIALFLGLTSGQHAGRRGPPALDRQGFGGPGPRGHHAFRAFGGPFGFGGPGPRGSRGRGGPGQRPGCGGPKPTTVASTVAPTTAPTAAPTAAPTVANP